MKLIQRKRSSQTVLSPRETLSPAGTSPSAAPAAEATRILRFRILPRLRPHPPGVGAWGGQGCRLEDLQRRRSIRTPLHRTLRLTGRRPENKNRRIGLGEGRFLMDGKEELQKDWYINIAPIRNGDLRWDLSVQNGHGKTVKGTSEEEKRSVDGLWLLHHLVGDGCSGVGQNFLQLKFFH